MPFAKPSSGSESSGSELACRRRPGSTRRGEGAHATIGPAETARTSTETVTEGAVEPMVPPVKEWHVLVSIFESGDDASANVVLLTEAADAHE